MIGKILRKFRLALTSQDNTDYRLVQGIYNGVVVDNIELLSLYGFSANPTKDSMILVMDVGRGCDHKVGICYNPATRFRNLKPGEVKAGNETINTFIYFDSDGNITISANSNTTINSQNAVVNAGTTIINSTTSNNGNFTINGNLSVSGTIDSGSSITAGGSITTTASISAGGGMTAFSGMPEQISFADIRTIYNVHTHIDSQGGDTTQPNNQL